MGLLDEGGAPLAGYGPDDMEPIRGDHLGHPLHWRDRDTVGDLHGRWITLEIELQGAELFAVHKRATPRLGADPPGHTAAPRPRPHRGAQPAPRKSSRPPQPAAG